MLSMERTAHSKASRNDVGAATPAKASARVKRIQGIVCTGPRQIRGIWFDPRPLTLAAARSGLNQTDLAQRIGCSKPQISNVLLGKSPTSPYLKQLADLLGVAIERIWLDSAPADFPIAPTQTRRFADDPAVKDRT